MSIIGIWTPQAIADTIRKSFDLLSQSDKIRIEEMCIKLLRKELQLSRAARRAINTKAEDGHDNKETPDD